MIIISLLLFLAGKSRSNNISRNTASTTFRNVGVTIITKQIVIWKMNVFFLLNSF